jgi:segregation and condensation protein B
MGDGENNEAAAPQDEEQNVPTEAPEDGDAPAPKKKRKRGKKKGPIDLSKVAAAASDDAAPEGGDVAASAEAQDAPSGDEPVAEADDGQPVADDDADQDGETPEGEASEDGEEKLKKRSKKAAEPVDPSVKAAVEAIIFAADDPVTPAAIAKAIGDVKPAVIRKAIEELCRERETSGISIVEVAGGWTMLTREEYAPAIRRLRKATESRKLTAAALETLAVVAYKQPIQKQEIEDIRGVSCGPILRTLMEQNLVKIAGRAEALGRPLLYGTTKRFLDVFGIPSLKDLPKISELKQE